LENYLKADTAAHHPLKNEINKILSEFYSALYFRRCEQDWGCLRGAFEKEL
jgi:hypothetical protein